MSSPIVITQEVPPADLSGYEVERAQNMEQNEAELRRLGLLGKQRSQERRDLKKSPLKKPPAEHKSHGGVRASAGGGSSSGRKGSSAALIELSDSDDAGGSAVKRQRGEEAAAGEAPMGEAPVGEAQGVSEPGGSVSTESESRIRNLFYMLQNGGVSAEAPTVSTRGESLDLLYVRQLALSVRHLSLEIGDDELPEMIDCFDQGGKGALTLNEFAKLVKHIRIAL